MRYDQITPVPPLTKVTKTLIIICVVTYVICAVFLNNLGFNINGLTIDSMLGLVPLYIKDKFWVWQFVTYIFLHGSPLHILLNMLILWYFGAELELRLGERTFLKYFLICGIGAGVFNVAVNLAFSNAHGLTPIVGASGSIFGILAAYGIFFGNRYFLVLFIFPMRAKYFVLLIGLLELVSGLKNNPQDNVAHFAHLGGMVVGAIYIYFKFIRPTGRRGSSRQDHAREKLRKQFRLIVNQPGSESESENDENNSPRGPYWN